MFRRRQADEDRPLRGPGGGKVRPRPQRKAARRRKQGLSDFLALGAIGGVLTLLVEHYALHLDWPFAVLAGLGVAVLSVLWPLFLQRRRAAREAAAAPKRTKRR